MKKWWCSFFTISLLFFLLSTAIFAEEETVFDDYVEEEGTFTADGETYTVFEYMDYEGVRISSNTYGSIIIENEGSSTVKGPYTYHLDEISQTGNIVLFKISVTKELPEIDVEREISNSTVAVTDDVTITVTITNEAEDSLSIAYSENLPAEVDLVGTPEITKGTSTSSQKSSIADVYWSGVLYTGDSVTITYTVEVDSYPTTGNTILFDDASLTYEDDTGEYPATIDALSLDLVTPLILSFTQETEDDDIGIGNEVEYTLTVANTQNNELTVFSLLLELSDGLVISYYDPAFEETASGYLWAGNVTGYQEETSTFIVIPQGTGTHTLEAHATYGNAYEQDPEEQNGEASTSFSIEAAPVLPLIITNSANYEGGEEIILYYYVNNTDEEISYSSVDITITSSLFDTIHYVASLPKKTLTLIKKQNFTAPFSDEELEYTVKMSGDLGAENTFEVEKEIIVNPSTFSVPYELSYTVDGVDEFFTNITLSITLLTTLTEKPTQLEVIHYGPQEYKKTISLTAEQIEDLFSEGSVQKSWSITTVGYEGESALLEIQLHYTIGENEYYSSLEESIPLFSGEEVAAEETEEIVNQTTTEPVEEETQEEIQEELKISGESEALIGKWVWFFIFLLCGIGVFFSIRYFVTKKKREKNIQEAMKKFSGKKEEKKKEKSSFFSKAKQIIIHDVPSPDEGYEELESYLKDMLDQGKTPDEVKKYLLQKGWLEDVVDSYLRRMK